MARFLQYEPRLPLVLTLAVSCLIQILEPAAAQLSAAIFSLIAALTARRHTGPFLMWCLYNLSFARWGLEGDGVETLHDELLLCLSLRQWEDQMYR